MSSRARAVSRPGSPGPAPTRYAVTVPGPRVRPRSAGARPRRRPARSGSSPSSSSRTQALPSGAPDEGAQRERRRRVDLRVGPDRRVAVGRPARAPARARRRAPAPTARGRWPRRAPARRPRVVTARQPWPGGRDELVQRRARVAAAQALQPGARPARSRRSRPRPACAGGCRRCRAARPRRGPRAARAAARCVAATRCRRAPRPPARASDVRAAQRVARVGALRHGGDDDALGQLRRHVLGRVHGAVDAAVEQRSVELAHPALLVRGGFTAVAAGDDLDQLVLAAQQRRPPGAPAPGPARCRASRSSRPALERADVVGRRRLGRRLGRRRASAGASSSPKSSRSSCWRPCPLSFRRIVGSCSSRCMTARATASMRARSRGDAVSQRPCVLGQHLVDDLGAVLAQRSDGRHDVELRQPAREALDLLLDDRLGPRPLGLAHAQVARDDGLQVVHVVDAHARRARRRRARRRAARRCR